MMRLLIAMLLLPLFISPAFAGGAYTLADGQSIIGLSGSYSTKEGDSLLDLARLYGLGYNEISEANPKVDPWVPAKGTHVDIPTEWILPDAPAEGIVINLAELRLYFYKLIKGDRYVMTFPLGIGREGLETPLGQYKVVSRIANPAWHVPKSIRDDDPTLPAVVPPGPANPLGTHAIRLSLDSYLIHGTNKPYGVGRRVSHGCIRMYPEDIVNLYKYVRPGNDVRIVYQPIKVGVRGGKVFIEVHDDYLGAVPDLKKEAMRLLEEKGQNYAIDRNQLRTALEQKKGVPVQIDTRQQVGPVYDLGLLR